MVPQITDQVLYKGIPQEAQEGGLGQAITIWSDPHHAWTIQVPKSHIEILKGKGSIIQVSREINRHTYVATAQTPLFVRENTLYFPAWNVYIDGQMKNITVLTNAKPRGVISFSVPKGKHIITVIFQDSLQMKIGKLLSVITFLAMLLITFLNKKFKFSFSIKKRKH